MLILGLMLLGSVIAGDAAGAGGATAAGCGAVCAGGGVGASGGVDDAVSSRAGGDS